MTTSINFNTYPYFDDFNEDKQFYRVLFKPGYPVQARELTQLQTILQNQIEKFGRHMFENGSLIIPGDSTYYTIAYAKVDQAYAIKPPITNAINESLDLHQPMQINDEWIFTKVMGTESGCVAEIIDVILEPTDTVQRTIYYRSLTGSLSNDVSSHVNINAHISHSSFHRLYVSKVDFDKISIGMIVQHWTGIKHEKRNVIEKGRDPTNMEYYIDLYGDNISFNRDVNNQVSLTLITSSQFIKNELLVVYKNDDDLKGLSQRYIKISNDDSAVGFGLKGRVSSGVFFANGFFINVPTTECFISHYLVTATRSVGIKISEEICSASEDDSLNDPANYMINYKAPGSDRLKIRTELESLSIEEANSLSSNKQYISFIELMRFDQGRLEKKLSRTIYAELAKEFARRTYDESGHYWVKPFITRAENVPDHKDDIHLVIYPGKAYVKGYEIETILPKVISVSRPKETITEFKKTTGYRFANHLYVDIARGIPRLHAIYDIYSSDEQSSIISEQIIDIGSEDHFIIGYEGSDVEGVKIGQCRIYSILKDGIWTALGLYDFQWISGMDLRMVPGVKIVSTDGGQSFAAVAIEHPKYGSFREDVEPTFVIPLQENHIKSLRPQSTASIEYNVLRIKRGVQLNQGMITNVFSGTEEFQQNDLFFMVESSNKSPIDISSVNFVNSRDIIVYTESNVTNINVDIAYVVQKNGVKEKTKNLNIVTDEYVKLNQGQGILANTDIHQLISVDNDSSLTMLNKFTIQSGITDTAYINGTISSDDGYFGVTNVTIKVSYSYFKHSQGDFFSVDSYYQSGIDYDDIPKYTFKSGQTISLANCLDFRPTRLEGFSSLIESEFIVPYGYIQFDAEYYIPRIDQLVINQEGRIRHVPGTSNIAPTPPRVSSDEMAMYHIHWPDYTFSANDIVLKMIDNRNYTMRDIAKLDHRLTQLEEYTTLSLLERSTLDMQITDGQGNNRFKSGIFVDDFSSTQQMLLTSTRTDGVIINESMISLDAGKKIIRPSYCKKAIKMEAGNHLSNVTIHQGIITLKYTSILIDSQPYASTSFPINPYFSFALEGMLTISPHSDFWKDPIALTHYVKNHNNLVRNRVVSWAQMGIIDTVWNDWQLEWEGIPVTRAIAQKVAVPSIAINASHQPITNQSQSSAMSFIAQATSSDQQNQIRRDSSLQLSPEFYNRSTQFGDRMVVLNVNHYVRERTIYLKIEGMKPRTKVFVFFDGVNVTEFCSLPQVSEVSSVFQLSASDIQEIADKYEAVQDFITNEWGRLYIQLNIPGGQFFVGEKLIEVKDSLTTENTSTYASKIYLALGIKPYTEDENQGVTNISSRQILNESSLIETLPGGNIQATLPRQVTPISIDNIDPIAQTFTAPRKFNHGCFIESIGVYFKKTSSRNPVRLEIRTTRNGFPTQQIMGAVTLLAMDVQSDSDKASQETIFKLPHPLYISPNVEYAFLLISSDPTYEVWVSRLGDQDVSSEYMITVQPNLGILYKSERDGEWVAHPEYDIKFNIYGCDFSQYSNGTIRCVPQYNDMNVRLHRLSFSTVEDDRTLLKVICPNHSLVVGDVIALTRVEESLNMAQAVINELGKNLIFTLANSNFNPYHIVVVKIIDSHTIAIQLPFVVSPIESTQFGDDLWVISAYARLDTLYTAFEDHLSNKSHIEYSIRTASMQRTPFSLTVTNAENTRLSQSGCVMNGHAWTLGHGNFIDTYYDIKLYSYDPYVSPIIDLDRSYMLCIMHTIDNRPIINFRKNINSFYQTATPPAFVYAHNVLDSSEARYISKEVKLINPARGLKILFSASKPSNTNIEVYYRIFAAGESLETNHQKDWYKAFNKEFININKLNNTSIDVITEKNRANPHTEIGEFKDMYYETLVFDENNNIMINNSIEVDELYEFTSFQIKLIMKSNNTCVVPEIKELRVIAVI